MLTKKFSILLVLILIFGFFLRVYNIENTLGFYFDQGRDALIIWDLWHNGNLFLIGPTTGIAGIFRGPFYYYLIAPFYLIGAGNPVWPSVFLSITTVVASFFGFYLGKKIHSNTAGIIMAVFSSVSFNIVMASRWLSNPTPMLLLSMLLVFFMLVVAEGKKWGWYGISTVLGLSLFSFGSASEVFYLLAIFIFAIWYRKTLDKKNILISLFLLFLTVSPLLLFDFKNNFLITNNIKKFILEDESFKLATWAFSTEKIEMYKRVFGSLIFHGKEPREMFSLGAIITLIIYYFRDLLRLNGVKILVLLLSSVTIGLIFFQGNEGNFYDYYLTGYYMIFLLLFSIGLGEIWNKKIFGKVLILLFLFLFLNNNLNVLKFKLTDNVESSGSIALKSEMQAVNWIKNDIRVSDFNIDVYVPPVISYSYDYLFKWQGVNQSDKMVPLLYTLYEGDPNNSQRLKEWLKRQDGYGKVKEKAQFGGISVERRIRY
ncbi:hypothetical protein A2130_02390 [Candidatus Woesebacteria bacterium GWC2_33_12]|uniref:Glycosyltransferase RgtA/B/C/D-like domain-containing protein n=1 Tax=Candidatus Woesebacteria bacterium GW2011_GWB1_33_22 TaxID=1618566 RepID=A0A0G0C2N9_9BACT|nr:MAG: hypothetical protein UR29_C0006G0017 [Candidatus Woesebacteria bacterium GW2011_GWC2_33_12]KKP42806.1 MAG: hypothetical protein UR33_C0001G0167 [Candidatus Woesebacteria bacterium GW2011_GWA2_33_20]KKP45420.1 MAG: hypothetical protein UR35_C0001G0017 [Candidatus Woesebacteria bacterium GW2011_GWB1_33_22]KKP46261.1 MAG: hypothetical protein UR37_C0010G0017 [Microgenomates group bacterium GW2011_GWC1_33_28]KKP50370.1 MAG: hypothetical protein UR41_C0009G0017 [Candidatus Woesebacteria bact